VTRQDLLPDFSQTAPGTDQGRPSRRRKPALPAGTSVGVAGFEPTTSSSRTIDLGQLMRDDTLSAPEEWSPASVAVRRCAHRLSLTLLPIYRVERLMHTRSKEIW
jgi:hypothetical protein